MGKQHTATSACASFLSVFLPASVCARMSCRIARRAVRGNRVAHAVATRAVHCTRACHHRACREACNPFVICVCLIVRLLSRRADARCVAGDSVEREGSAAKRARGDEGLEGGVAGTSGGRAAAASPVPAQTATQVGPRGAPLPLAGSSTPAWKTPGRWRRNGGRAEPLRARSPSASLTGKATPFGATPLSEAARAARAPGSGALAALGSARART